jgi:Tfp pilus assembly protein PilO
MPEEKKSQFDFNQILGKAKDIVLNFLIPLVALTLTGLLGIFYIRPSIKELPEKKEELQTKISTRDTLSGKVANLNRLKDYQSILDENLEIVNKVLVPEPEAPKLLDQATQIAERAGMSLEKLSYSYSSKAKSGGTFDMITVSMGVTSSFEQFVTFMEIVENAARYVSVPDFRYSISDKGDDVGKLSSNFSIDSPYLFVQSAAVTDDPVNLDITSPEFIGFMDMLKGLDYYDFINPNIEAPVEEPQPEPETPAIEEPVEEPVETPVEEPSQPENEENNNSIFITE